MSSCKKVIYTIFTCCIKHIVIDNSTPNYLQVQCKYYHVQNYVIKSNDAKVFIHKEKEFVSNSLLIFFTYEFIFKNNRS